MVLTNISKSTNFRFRSENTVLSVHILRTAESTIDLTELIASTSSGCAWSEDRLRKLLRPGVRWLLNRRAADPSLAEPILSQVLERVHRGDISAAPDILRETSLAIVQASGRKSTEAPATAADGGHTIESGLSGREREMMRRFYVDRESPDSICRKMSVSPGTLGEVKRRFRAAMGDGVELLTVGERPHVS